MSHHENDRLKYKKLDPQNQNLMRRAAKTDRNQIAIVSALRELGASVAPLHQVGGGIPDILVGFEGRNFLVEIKDGSKPRSAQKLTECQVRFHNNWLGQIAVVTSPEQAIALLNLADRIGIETAS